MNTFLYIAVIITVLGGLCVSVFLERYMRSADIRKMEEIKDEINSGCNMMVNASTLMVDYLKLKPKDRTDEILDAIKGIEQRADIRMDWRIGSLVSVGGKLYEVIDVCSHSGSGEMDTVQISAMETTTSRRAEEEGEKV